MLQISSKAKIADNTGGKIARVIGTYGASRRRFVGLGDVVKISVIKALPDGSVEKHDTHRAVVVRARKETERKDGSFIRFDDNAVVIIGQDNDNPLGSRVFGPVAREVKDKGFDKIVSLAPEVL